MGNAAKELFCCGFKDSVGTNRSRDSNYTARTDKHSQDPEKHLGDEAVIEGAHSSRIIDWGKTQVCSE